MINLLFVFFLKSFRLSNKIIFHIYFFFQKEYRKFFLSKRKELLPFVTTELSPLDLARVLVSMMEARGLQGNVDLEEALSHYDKVLEAKASTLKKVDKKTLIDLDNWYFLVSLFFK